MSLYYLKSNLPLLQDISIIKIHIFIERCDNLKVIEDQKRQLLS